MNRFSSMIKILSLSAFMLVFSQAAVAQNPTIETAKAQCLIGEQIDGYLGVVSGKKPTTEQLREMRSINQKRKIIYADLAKKNGVTVQVTAQLTAEKLIAKADPGECVQMADGKWAMVPAVN